MFTAACGEQSAQGGPRVDPERETLGRKPYEPTIYCATPESRCCRRGDRYKCCLAMRSCSVRCGLVTQNTQLALEGLILFFATYFYTLIRLYQLGSSDTGDEASYPVRSTLPAN